jgi:hypothetical protein
LNSSGCISKTERKHAVNEGSIFFHLSVKLKFSYSRHSLFHSLGGSSICSYFVHNVEQTFTDYSEYGKLITVRLNSHSGVILARRFGKGLALALE